MVNHFSSWMRSLIFLSLLGFIWSCKETKQEPVQQEPEIAAPKPITKEIKEVLDFAGISATRTEELPGLITFLETGGSGMVQPTSAEEVTARLKQMKTSKKLEYYPIVEIQGSDHVVLVLQGRGFAGPIWGHLLLNKKTMVLEKVQFDHRAETEGYGDVISYNSFENQFTEKTLLPETPGFQLNVPGQKLEPGSYPVDGISGATQSIQAVIDMVNAGLSVYSPYLFP